MFVVYTLLLLLVGITVGEEKPETSEQIDPSIYIRNNANFMNGMTAGVGQNSMNMVNFAFNCKCTSKMANPLAPAPMEANQLAQQQIAQLQVEKNF
ncbi:unnamed protein product [Caenorhabditis bovis]|uniref:Uncharacterized protein n=1 Tax=Caenorhabditis bovis TaxID=2654633 RepID=A0A8S1F461_9PELO|nr:unnamed protein product [Caenorhabditis bovis]